MEAKPLDPRILSRQGGIESYFRTESFGSFSFCPLEQAKTSMKPFIIPIFLPQMACPYRCIYCHQPKITQRSSKILDHDQFEAIIKTGLASQKRKPAQETEIAFYGGTFTNLSKGLQAQMLSWAGEYMGPGRVTSLRLSTRPDAISLASIEWLLGKGVRTIELGIQSLDDSVLALCNRGHNRRQAVEAILLLKKYSVRVGVQLMVGLPGDSAAGFLDTAAEVVTWKPDLVRIYPTLVFAETALAQWLSEGRYRPLALEEALHVCSQALDLFESAGIPVIRLGLQDHPAMNLEKGLLAGPFHPAFGFLVRGYRYLNKLRRDLVAGEKGRPSLVLSVSPGDAGYLLGHQRKNLNHLIQETGLAGLAVKSNPNLSPGQWRLGDQ
jgi:histone acetyltransferase (RNA polymerase elongator complex component)